MVTSKVRGWEPVQLHRASRFMDLLEVNRWIPGWPFFSRQVLSRRCRVRRSRRRGTGILSSSRTLVARRCGSRSSHSSMRGQRSRNGSSRDHAHLNLERNFRLWLKQARADFENLEKLTTEEMIQKFTEQKFAIRVPQADIAKILPLLPQEPREYRRVHVITDKPPRPWCK